MLAAADCKGAAFVPVGAAEAEAEADPKIGTEVNHLETKVVRKL
jgi:hypothetical protein